MDYKKTLCLPKIDLSSYNKDISDFTNLWEKFILSKKKQKLNKLSSKRTIYNLPFFSNKELGINDLVCLFLKDILIKYY
ncbi:MAG: hypothetical protein ACUVWN_17025, partial [bacterium]